MHMPMPAEHDHADCDRPLIHTSGSNNMSKSTVNMNSAPSRLPSLRSIHSERKSVKKSRANREIMR